MSKTGLFASAGRLFSNLIELLLNRLSILSIDLEISIQRVISITSLFLFGVFFLCMATFLLVILLIAIYWDTHRVLVIASMLGFFIVVGLALLLVARQKLKKMPAFFEATIAELKKDHQSIHQKVHHNHD